MEVNTQVNKDSMQQLGQSWREMPHEDKLQYVALAAARKDTGFQTGEALRGRGPGHDVEMATRWWVHLRAIDRSTMAMRDAAMRGGSGFRLQRSSGWGASTRPTGLNDLSGRAFLAQGPEQRPTMASGGAQEAQMIVDNAGSSDAGLESGCAAAAAAAAEARARRDSYQGPWGVGRGAHVLESEKLVAPPWKDAKHRISAMVEGLERQVRHNESALPCDTTTYHAVCGNVCFNAPNYRKICRMHQDILSFYPSADVCSMFLVTCEGSLGKAATPFMVSLRYKRPAEFMAVIFDIVAGATDEDLQSGANLPWRLQFNVADAGNAGDGHCRLNIMEGARLMDLIWEQTQLLGVESVKIQPLEFSAVAPNVVEVLSANKSRLILAKPVLGLESTAAACFFPEAAPAQGFLLVGNPVPGASTEVGRRILSLINIEVEVGRRIKI
eukprot:5700166-Pyramimonas_sp.AAC.1